MDRVHTIDIWVGVGYLLSGSTLSCLSKFWGKDGELGFWCLWDWRHFGFYESHQDSTAAERRSVSQWLDFSVTQKISSDIGIIFTHGGYDSLTICLFVFMNQNPLSIGTKRFHPPRSYLSISVRGHAAGRTEPSPTSAAFRYSTGYHCRNFQTAS
jgi:hypothetical protein